MKRLPAACAAILLLSLCAVAQQAARETSLDAKIVAPELNSSEAFPFFASSSIAAHERRRALLVQEKPEPNRLEPAGAAVHSSKLLRSSQAAPSLTTEQSEDSVRGGATPEDAGRDAVREALPARPEDKTRAKDKAPDVRVGEGFHWKQAFEQSLLLLAIQHGYAMTQPKTRRELRGPFFKDYVRSVANLHGWADGGRFFTNYIAHPLQGAATGFIQVQNDPKGIRQQFGGSSAYWRSRLKAFAWSAASSTQFELGPLSQAAIGNVGKARKLTYVDLVITPTVGTALLISEDALDLHVIRRIEDRTKNVYMRIAARMLLNPSRSCANLLRFKKPWHRDTR